MDQRFLIGFVKQCSDSGMTEEQTGEQVRLYVNNSLMSNAEIRKGAARVLDACGGAITKSAVAKVMQPALLADIIEHVVHEGKSAGAMVVRQYHPVHQALTEEFETLMKQASFLEAADTPGTRRAYDNFSQLPLSAKVELVAGLGGAAGGLANSISPRPSEAFSSPISRFGSGAMRGGALGAGAVLGGAAGKEVGSMVNTDRSFMGPGKDHRLAQLAGAGAGLYATNKLLKQIPF